MERRNDSTLMAKIKAQIASAVCPKCGGKGNWIGKVFSMQSFRDLAHVLRCQACLIEFECPAQ